MALNRNLTLGDAVKFFSSRFPTSVAAIVTSIQPSGENRHIGVLVLPPSGFAPFTQPHVQHKSLAESGADSWDFRSADDAVRL